MSKLLFCYKCRGTLELLVPEHNRNSVEGAHFQISESVSVEAMGRVIGSNRVKFEGFRLCSNCLKEFWAFLGGKPLRGAK